MYVFNIEHGREKKSALEMRCKIMPREIIRNIATIQITFGALSSFFFFLISISNRNNILYLFKIISFFKSWVCQLTSLSIENRDHI